MLTLSPLRLLAGTYFSDPDFNEAVKNGTVDSLPDLPFTSALGVEGQPMLPQQFIAQGYSDEPGTWPTLPSFVLPPFPFSWTGEDHHYPEMPSYDPFYWPDPASLEHMKNGDVIDYRPVGLSAFPEVREAWQILYRTESALGKPTADVTTLMIPWNYDGRHLLTYAPWEDANCIDCAPSYVSQRGARDPTMDMLLLQGWALNMPDHQGQKSAFAAGWKSGKSTLDSLRAVTQAQQFLPFTFEDSAMNGYSGGAIAVARAVELHPTYAPELEIKAASMGGIIADLNATLYTLNKGLFSAYAFGGLYGLAAEYEVENILQSALKDECRDRANQIRDHCLVWDVLNFVGQDLFSYMKMGSEVLKIPEFDYILKHEKLGKAIPKIPLYIYQAGSDEIAPTGRVEELIDLYCQNGVRIDYHRDDALGHLLESVGALAGHIKFLNMVFDEDYVPMTCRNYQDALNNNGVYVPIVDDLESLANAVYGDYRAWGLPNLVGI